MRCLYKRPLLNYRCVSRCAEGPGRSVLSEHRGVLMSFVWWLGFEGVTPLQGSPMVTQCPYQNRCAPRTSLFLRYNNT